MKNTVKLFLFLILGLTLSSCTQFDEGIIPETDSYMDVSFTVGLPSSPIVATRSLNTGSGASNDENTVSKIHVLMFDGAGMYQGVTTVSGIGGAGGIAQGASGNSFRTKTFSVTVKKDVRSFIFLANVDVNLSSYSTDGTVSKSTIQNNVLNVLTVAEAAIDNSSSAVSTNYLPMWGEHSINQAPTATISGILLLRSVASIDIVSTSGKNITEVYLVNRYTAGRVVPASANLTDGIVTAPTTTGSLCPSSFSNTSGNGKNYCSAATASFKGRLMRSSQITTHRILIVSL